MYKPCSLTTSQLILGQTVKRKKKLLVTFYLNLHVHVRVQWHNSSNTTLSPVAYTVHVLYTVPVDAEHTM